MDVQPGMTAQAPPRVLLVTLRATGGVAALVKAAQDLLAERGWRADIAWYEPYRQSPGFSVPVFALPFRRPRSSREPQGDGTLLHRVGVRLPELEALRYRPTRLWRAALANYDLVIAVCGSVLQAGVALRGRVPCLAWVSSPFDADRNLRRRGFPLPRRLLDALLDAPLCRRLERALLRRLPLITISRYTADALEALEPAARVLDVVPWPLDLDEVTERPWRADAAGQRIGFFGRYSDPRKRTDLLLRAFAAVRRARPSPVTLVLAGDTPTLAIRREVEGLGLAGAVELHEQVSRPALLELYAGLDLFVVPSEQEGLCIVGLEAMGSGRPVLSTRCGGPQDFVIEGETGWLCDGTVEALSARIATLLDQPPLLRETGRRARVFVAERYGRAAVSRRFHAALDRVLTPPVAAMA